MILKKGDPTAKLPEAVDPTLVRLSIWNANPMATPSSFCVMVAQVSPEEIINLPFKTRTVRGFPCVFAVYMSDTGTFDRILLHPIPDRDLTADLLYHTPMKRA